MFYVRRFYATEMHYFSSLQQIIEYVTRQHVENSNPLGFSIEVDRKMKVIKLIVPCSANLNCYYLYEFGKVTNIHIVPKNPNEDKEGVKKGKEDVMPQSDNHNSTKYNSYVYILQVRRRDQNGKLTNWERTNICELSLVDMQHTMIKEAKRYPEYDYRLQIYHGSVD